MLNPSNPAYYEFSKQELARIDPSLYPGLFDQTVYESDEFRMYGFKIKQCPRVQSHDWTQCPFAHRGEKARRRDPRKYNYAAVPCPDYGGDRGVCLRGETCHFAHGVFECWLHPAKYRTRACNASDHCLRQVCFFAHTPEELREEPKIKYQYAYRVRSYGDDDVIAKGSCGNGGSTSASLPVPVGTKTSTSASTSTSTSTSTSEGNCDFLASLSGLKVREGDEMAGGIFGW